ncbi:Hypothetical predicted protein [Paramuricea clavata]|uniref:Uncharacterized protein n=1 Tax=Paramuricea clavata TaxID=317549 RepID=A0A6S7HWD5_PARCT|nr:Hypothetical predicted protein [Paramuricea clavata]
MAHYTSTIRGPSHNVSHSYVQSMKPTKMVDIQDRSLSDHSIFVGYGSNAKRIKDRWEATKKQLRFENNYIALKWLLDSFVDDYLRSKNMEDTATLTRETVFIKKERRDEITSTQSRRPVNHHSPSKTRFEDTVTERKENGIIDKPLHGHASESRQHVSSIKERRSGDGSRIASGDLHIAGQYPYKYVPEYWSPYYHWHGNVPVNSRIVNVTSIPGYSGYMMKTPSCSSLPTRDIQKPAGGLRTCESLKQLNRDGNDERGESSTVSEKRPAVNLGFKTKSMPNLQFIPKENEVNSEEEDEIESDPESQGDLIALSTSSLSMPNLRKIPQDRVPRLSPPSRGHFEAAPLLRDDVCNASSFSMPNLKAIQGGIEHDDRKKTIRDFVINRLTGTKDHDQAELKTKIFNPNGFYPPSSLRDSERKLVIRERLLNRLAKRKREENIQAPHHNGKMTSQGTSRLKFARTLPQVSESRLWPEKNYMQARDARMLDKDDHANNNWKVPQAVGSSEHSRNMVGISFLTYLTSSPIQSRFSSIDFSLGDVFSLLSKFYHLVDLLLPTSGKLSFVILVTPS